MVFLGILFKTRLKYSKELLTIMSKMQTNGLEIIFNGCLRPVGYSWVQLALKFYTSELILCFTICACSATRHNIHMYSYFLFAAIHHLNRPRLSLSDLVAQSAE